MRDIVNQQEVRVVIEGKSIADQIIKLPLESIILAHGVNVLDTVIHRTGSNGWLLTRGKGGCLSNDAIRELVADYEQDGATFTVLREGKHL